MRNTLKISITLSLIAISFLRANTQNLQFGVFADSQLSWFTSDTKGFTPAGVVFGFNAGFVLERYFDDRYAVTTGASIANSGGIIQFNNVGDTLNTLDGRYTIDASSNVKIKSQFLSIPIGLKFKTNEIGYTTFYAELGVKSNIRLKAYAWEETLNIEREVLENNQFNFVFLSYYIGTGLQYSLGGPSAIQAGIIFSNGLTPPFKNNYNRINIGTIGLKVGLIF